VVGIWNPDNVVHGMSVAVLCIEDTDFEIENCNCCQNENSAEMVDNAGTESVTLANDRVRLGLKAQEDRHESGYWRR